MAELPYIGTINAPALTVTESKPLDVRTVVNSVENLTDRSIPNLYTGIVVNVKGTADLYVLVASPRLANQASSWMKVGGELGVADVITSDGSAPASGNGFSISGNDPDALIEETYVDNGFEPNTYYSGRGLNSSDSNGTGTLGDVEYITLSNGGDSYIRLNSADDDNWIEINIVDDSLGLSISDITYIDSNGEVQTVDASPLVLPKETPVSFGENGFDFTGLTETREDDPTEYVFGEDGSTYEDVDIYSSSALPTVYAYSDNNPVRVLTEGDKVEIINMIENVTVDRISDEEILGIF